MAGVELILGTMTFGEQVDEPAARGMIDTYKAGGYDHLDTAYLYCDGRTEEILGRLIAPAERSDFFLATKAHPTERDGLSGSVVTGSLETSLARLNTDCVDLFYLHSPAPETPIVETLRACFDLYQQGKFRRFGLSNYAAWQVAEIAELCRSHGWMTPTVYQGMYNAFTRDVERELFPCLRNYGMSFYAYNPLAGGLLSGKHPAFAEGPVDGRFKLHDNYRDRFWSEQFFQAMDELRLACGECGIPPAAAALRWLANHSCLSPGDHDGIVLGVSKPEQLEDNLRAAAAGPLPDAVVEALDRGWEIARPHCIKYFRP